jgi:peptidoglycan hydrolase CwlO-like protein
MNKRLLMIIMLCVLVLTAAASGCTAPGAGDSSIKNSEQASGAITNISNDVQDVASALEDIDNKLG